MIVKVRDLKSELGWWFYEATRVHYRIKHMHQKKEDAAKVSEGCLDEVQACANFLMLHDADEHDVRKDKDGRRRVILITLRDEGKVGPPDERLLVIDTEAFIMNDAGKTIERIS